MGLIGKILSRKSKGRVKVDVHYIKKVHKLLKRAVEDIQKTAVELNALEKALIDLKGREKSREFRIIKTKLTNKEENLTERLKKLDEAVAMYFKIDNLGDNYSNEIKPYLGELQKYWHSIKLESLSPEQWSTMVKIIVENNLQNARLLIG